MLESGKFASTGELALTGELRPIGIVQHDEAHLLGELASVGELACVGKVQPSEAFLLGELGAVRLPGELVFCLSSEDRLVDEVEPLGELGPVGEVQPSGELEPSGEPGKVRLFELASELRLSDELDEVCLFYEARLNCRVRQICEVRQN